jgi:predicted DCC family thiol-disulfide oxidoreductase YuxK
MNGVDITENLPPRLVVFDGVCNLCNGAVQFIINHDPSAGFMFTSLQSDIGQQILTQYALPQDDFDSFIYVREQKLYQRSTAALYVLHDLGGIWKVLYGFIIIPRPIRDWVYDRIAKSRYSLFGKRDSCMIPTPALKKRFL